MARKKIDWESIEKDYRAGIKTHREIAEAHGCSHGAVQKRAKKYAWTRDLTGKIKEAAKNIVAKEEVAKKVAKKDEIAERDIVEANANLQASVMRGQRKSVQKSCDLVGKLLAELDGVTDSGDLVELLGEAMRSDASVDKMNDAYRKIVSLPGRIDAMKKLSDSMKTMVGLERQVFGLDDIEPGDNEAKEVCPQEMSTAELMRFVKRANKQLESAK